MSFDPWDWWGVPEEDADPAVISFVRVAEETPKAWRVMLEDGGGLVDVFVWLPKSQCVIHEDHISLPWWLMEEKELEKYLVEL